MGVTFCEFTICSNVSHDHAHASPLHRHDHDQRQMQCSALAVEMSAVRHHPSTVPEQYHDSAAAA